jgi:hypothetical protein
MQSTRDSARLRRHSEATSRGAAFRFVLLFCGILLVTANSGAARRTYYLSPSGSDSSDGLTANTAWLTPNHPDLKCGDDIIAAPGAYAAMTITATPVCSTHDAVWVKCEMFDRCRISQRVSTQGGINVQASYWAFLGWEVTVRGGPWASCFSAIPSSRAKASIHDIYFINDIANGCIAGGFVAANSGSNGVDYFIAVADIAYNGAQGSAYCYSGVSVLHPVAADDLSGTHIYISQVFAWHNLEPPTCAGHRSTDGEGIILDSFNGGATGLVPYAQQAAIENVVTVYNGAYGILAGGGSGNSMSRTYVRHATAYGNFINSTQRQPLCAQIASIGWPTENARNANHYTAFTNNIAITDTRRPKGCGDNVPYAYFLGNLDATDSFVGNAGYSTSDILVGYKGLNINFKEGVNYLSNTITLRNPAEPPPPACTGTLSVIDCMATVIANFRPSSRTWASFGYQPPSSKPRYDALFPQSLCHNKHLPPSLITMGCTVP